MKNNKGFSLVELLIVIAIMAILVGIVAPQLMKYVEKAKVSSDQQLLDSVYDAIVYTSLDPDVMADPLSQAIYSDMTTGAVALEDLENTSKYPSGNLFTAGVLSILGWDNLSHASYIDRISSKHEATATIYFTYKGHFMDPVIAWITTTDSEAKKDTSHAPTNYIDGDAANYAEIKHCVNVE